MTDALSKLLKFLDQLLPFLATSPAWLRAWVYILIVLNFATIAAVSISYLASRERSLEDESLQRFSIDRPAGNEEIPLGASRSWMIEGKFPIAGEKEEPPKLSLDVLKLPDREPAPQDGKVRLDTVEGFWRFESARFPGEGSYEIVATVARGNQTLPRMVAVKCTEKAQAYRDSIERGRKTRGVSKLSEATVTHVSLAQLKTKLAALEQQFWRLYETNRDLNAALSTASKALDLLDPVLPQYPNDFELQNYRAYFLKDYGMVERDLNRPEDAEAAWKEANKMFEAIREQQPNDPAAWNGLGSMASLRGDYAAALQYIDKALQLQPDYSAAQQDRELVLKQLQEQKKSTRH